MAQHLSENTPPINHYTIVYKQFRFFTNAFESINLVFGKVSFLINE